MRAFSCPFSAQPLTWTSPPRFGICSRYFLLIGRLGPQKELQLVGFECPSPRPLSRPPSPRTKHTFRQVGTLCRPPSSCCLCQGFLIAGVCIPRRFLPLPLTQMAIPAVSDCPHLLVLETSAGDSSFSRVVGVGFRFAVQTARSAFDGRVRGTGRQLCSGCCRPCSIVSITDAET